MLRVHLVMGGTHVGFMWLTWRQWWDFLGSLA